MVLLAVAAFVAIAFSSCPFRSSSPPQRRLGRRYVRHPAPVQDDGNAVAEPAQLSHAGMDAAKQSAVLRDRWPSGWRSGSAPLARAASWLGAGNVFAAEADFFSRMAMVTFGGAYAVLAYVAQQAVEVHGWLKPDEMLTGLGLAETTPGPLILVLVFVGFLGGARLSGLDPLAGGIAGAIVTLWFTFVPCFLWIFVGAPYVETARSMSVGWRARLQPLTAQSSASSPISRCGSHCMSCLRSRGTELGPFSVPVPDLDDFGRCSSSDRRLPPAWRSSATRSSMIGVLVTAAPAGVACRLQGL